jgi:hypothetical protein
MTNVVGILTFIVVCERKIESRYYPKTSQNLQSGREIMNIADVSIYY